MYARISNYEGRPGNTAQNVAIARDRALPACRQLDGFVGLLFLEDPASGKSLSITFWQTEDHMRRSEQAASTIREDAAGEAGDRIVSVERYQVSFDALTGAPLPA